MSRAALAVLFTALIAGPAAAGPAIQYTAGRVANPQASSTLTYRGGPILDHVKVFTVYWGKSVAYSGTGSQGLDSFYTGVVNSPYYDWLIEYKTSSQPSVGRGSFLGSYAYTAGATGSITDSQIESALGKLIDAGSLPTPDANTLFAIHFASGISITMSDGSKSCSVFCAYHSSFKHGSANVYYSVVPDQGGSCAGGCGNDASTFNNTTSVASHELVEATTDANVGQNDLAWYNDSKGEIGDICNAQQGCADGTKAPCSSGAYTVQLEWSNSLNKCISTNPNVSVNDFSVTANPTSLTVAQGGMATSTMTLAKTAGSSDTVKLSAAAPAGVTVSFAPTSAASDKGTSTMTVSAGPSAMIGTAKITVTATGSTSTHTADVQVMITAPPDMAMAAPDLAMDPGSGNGGTGGNGGGSGTGTGTGTGTGGNGSGGNGDNGGGRGGTDTGCSMGGGSIAGSWAFVSVLLLGLALRRRRA